MRLLRLRVPCIVPCARSRIKPTISIDHVRFVHDQLQCLPLKDLGARVTGRVLAAYVGILGLYGGVEIATPDQRVDLPLLLQMPMNLLVPVGAGCRDKRRIHFSAWHVGGDEGEVGPPEGDRSAFPIDSRIIQAECVGHTRDLRDDACTGVTVRSLPMVIRPCPISVSVTPSKEALSELRHLVRSELIALGLRKDEDVRAPFLYEPLEVAIAPDAPEAVHIPLPYRPYLGWTWVGCVLVCRGGHLPVWV